MLPKEKRLRKGHDFNRVYQKGKRLHSKSFNLSFYTNRSRLTKIGIVVGKKYSKKATERNRAKRVLRAAVLVDYDKIKSGFDIVIFVKNTAQTSKPEEIKKELFEAISKGGLKK